MRKLFLVALLALAGCDRTKPEAQPPTPVVTAQQTMARRAAEVPDPIKRHWTFLNQIRQDDAFSGSIHRTLLNEQGQLGVVLYSSVKPEEVPAMMEQVLGQMAHKFPGEDATFIVYMTSNPPRKLGVAQLDGKTGKTTYTPEK